MDFTSLENMDKSEFFPLDNIKQELIDSGNGTDDKNVTAGTSSDKNNGINENPNGGSGVGSVDCNESANAVCDSAEKQVKETFYSKLIR